MADFEKHATEEINSEGDSVAIVAELLFLSNLLLVPFFSFIALLWYYRNRKRYSPLALSSVARLSKSAIICHPIT